MEPSGIKPKLEAVLMATRRLVAVSDLVQYLGTSLDEVEDGLRSFEDDLRKPDRGLRLERKRGAVGINVKPKYEPLVARLFPLRAPNLTADLIETLAVIALMQPITTKAIAMIRHVASALVTVRKMARRGLIVHSHINGARHWHVTQAFLDRFDLVSSEELRDDAVFRETFPTVPLKIWHLKTESVFELETKPPVEPTANKEFELVPKMRPLSKESLEVLAVMAYRQPVSLADINTLRKVSSIGPLQTLRRRGLVVSNKTGKNGEM
jgi:chromosome segregation and condensation protein ScpB